jgi:hypothetical protein
MTILHDKLLSVFQESSAKSTGLLIMEVLFYWGKRRKNAGLSDDEREMAYRFYMKLQEHSPSFRYDECSNKFGESPNTLTFAEADTRAKELLNLLEEYPFETATDQFTLAAYDWLCCCDFQHFKEPGQTEQEAKLWLVRGWVDGLGVA